MVKRTTPECLFGEKAKPFNLQGVDGKYYSLEDCVGTNGLVVMFICNHCPYVKAITKRLVADAKTLYTLNIGVVAICSNDSVSYPEDSFENMQQFAKQHDFPFPYLHDTTQQVAKAYQAICTPDFFGFNQALELQYRGRLDESGMQPASTSAKHELVEAMKLIADTGTGPKQQFPSMGCSIKWL